MTNQMTTQNDLQLLPPPIEYSDLVGQCNGEFFMGILPQEIVDKIMAYVRDMTLYPLQVEMAMAIRPLHAIPLGLRQQVTIRDDYYDHAALLARRWGRHNRQVGVWTNQQNSTKEICDGQITVRCIIPNAYKCVWARSHPPTCDIVYGKTREETPPVDFTKHRMDSKKYSDISLYVRYLNQQHTYESRREGWHMSSMRRGTYPKTFSSYMLSQIDHRHSLKHLKEQCKMNGIKGYSKKDKMWLVNALLKC